MYVPSAAERADARLFADGVRAAMLAAGDLLPSPATLADCRAYLAMAGGRAAEMPAHSRAGRALMLGASAHPSPIEMKGLAREGGGCIEICVDARADVVGAPGGLRDTGRAKDDCKRVAAGACEQNGCSSAPTGPKNEGVEDSCEREALLALATEPGRQLLQW